MTAISALCAPARSNHERFDAPTGSADRSQILVVDADSRSSAHLVMVLDGGGYRVTRVTGDIEALKRARDCSFDLVIARLGSPPEDGLELTRLLRSDPVLQDIPILLLADTNETARRLTALDVGADEVVVGAISDSELVARVRVHLRHAIRTRELQMRALRDGLTGILNRKGIDEALGRELQRGSRTGAALAVMLVDVDRLKRINDERGHAAGDAVLQTVARAMASCVRLTDHAGRYGGDEFVVVLPDTDEAAALALAQRLRTAVAPVSISIGIAAAVPGDTPTTVISRADAAMYRDKNDPCRNRAAG
jgi:diguanylate cyclase (GGDEF)-like protein